MLVKWIKRIFQGEANKSGSQESRPDFFAEKIGSGPELETLTDRVKRFDEKIKKLQKMIKEFYKQQERMDDLAQKIIEVVAHVCTLDTKYKELEKKIQGIETIVGTPQEIKKNEKQSMFEL